MAAAVIEQKIQQFLIESTGDRSLKSDTDLLSSNILDSLTMMDLVAFIETEFQQRIALEDFRPELFKTVLQIAELVERIQTQRHHRAA